MRDVDSLNGMVSWYNLNYLHCLSGRACCKVKPACVVTTVHLGQLITDFNSASLMTKCLLPRCYERMKLKEILISMKMLMLKSEGY